MSYDERESYNKFMIVWHMYGIEAAIDLDQIEQDHVEAKLKGQNSQSSGHYINYYMMRSRLNTHRNYEIWCINLPTGTTNTDVFRWFDANPQSIVKLIRDHGVCLLPKIGQDPVIL